MIKNTKLFILIISCIILISVWSYYKKNIDRCERYTIKLQKHIDDWKIRGEEVGVFGNVSIIRETFYSPKLLTCVSLVEIINDYQKPPQRRIYSYDLINDKDLFSTDTYNFDDPKYQIVKNSFYQQVKEMR